MNTDVVSDLANASTLLLEAIDGLIAQVRELESERDQLRTAITLLQESPLMRRAEQAEKLLERSLEALHVLESSSCSPADRRQVAKAAIKAIADRQVTP